MPPTARDCSLQLLAHGHGCRVRRCSHGVVHLELGPVSLRIDEAQLRALADTLADARETLDARASVPHALPC